MQFAVYDADHRLARLQEEWVAHLGCSADLLTAVLLILSIHPKYYYIDDDIVCTIHVHITRRRN